MTLAKFEADEVEREYIAFRLFEVVPMIVQTNQMPLRLVKFVCSDPEAPHSL